jgi:hypothetical protein
VHVLNGLIAPVVARGAGQDEKGRIEAPGSLGPKPSRHLTRMSSYARLDRSDSPLLAGSRRQRWIRAMISATDVANRPALSRRG